ncbi:MAG: hypothetical protein M1825_003028 [Sarcosagium campestre]|nr:MAG: hypothetical protein M1825_003028 [Sarcosagium campestre]
MMTAKYDRVFELIDDAHAQDPKRVLLDSIDVPYELHYARKMTNYLVKLRPDASDTLRIAVRAQHFRRWEIPRDTYPMNRQGYLKWRFDLKKHQAELVTRICLQCDVSAAEAERVGALIRKENLKGDDETQTLEDVACLVFLDDQFEEFEKEHDEEKILNILTKTWAKMSERGHVLALQIPMSPRARRLVEKAVT